LYLGLEILSLSLYTLIAIARDRSEAVEAALKYFVLGAIASGAPK
jgi:NADH-quinone oxidoreductase subunit N